jgi:hypothetical protein
VGLAVLNGQMDLSPSDNSWDWLGGGIYFWEQNPVRALKYAEESKSGSQKNKIRIKTPFVLGAIIELGNCLNLMEPMSLGIIKSSYKSLKDIYKNLGEPMPQNRGANRQLDCAVIKYVHETRKETNQQPYDTIRCPFQEGYPVYDTSSFTERLHIEICVLNRELIKGYFLPRPVKEYNPHL